MEFVAVKINKEKVFIEKQVFLDLLDISPIRELSSYNAAITSREIRFQDLKILAQKAHIPYPLFFAPKKIAQKQIEDRNKRLYSRSPTKDEISLSSRGKLQVEDVALIIQDIGRKQEFLKTRVLTDSKENSYVGCIVKFEKLGKCNVEMASTLRNILEIDLQFLRSLSKQKVLSYICNKAEAKGIFISFSSHNYMPQNIHREVGLSGICIKDKKFPFIFINTRDGDTNPKILESEGRQVFTVLAMLVCIALNRFIISIKKTKKEEGVHKKVFEMVGEILVPAADIANHNLVNLDEIKNCADYFKVTPSMLLVRLKQLNKIDQRKFNAFNSKLSEELNKTKSQHFRSPLQINAYSKYNGERFSKEIIRAYHSKKINQEEVKNILFRQGKMNPGLFQEYAKKYS